MTRRPCLDCRAVFDGRGSRCTRCERAYQRKRNNARPQYRGDYPKLAALVRATPAPCAICGKWDIPGETWEAHHVDATTLARAHRKCNIVEGAHSPVFEIRGADARRKNIF